MKTKIKTKGQMSVELILISIAVLSVFLTMFAIINYRNTEITSTKQFLDSKDIADKLARDINEVYIGGFGSNRFVFLSNATLDNTPITLRVFPENRMVKIEWGERFYTSPLVTSRVVGNINGNTSENFTLIQGRVNLTNYMGEIRLAQ